MPDLMIVGEAYGREEEEQGQPFVGASGRVLNYLLSQVGISRREAYLTNVFNVRPKPTLDINNLCGPKAEGIPGMPSLASGKYVRAEYAPELDRLYSEIRRENPNLILALGASAVWALCKGSGIRAVRGAPLLGIDGRKVLATYHPSAVIGDWSLRPIVIADLTKARRELEYPDIRRPRREIWVEPSLRDMERFYEEHLLPCSAIAADIETKLDQITCIGFAPSRDLAIVVPFYNPMQMDGNYWRSLGEELAAWAWVKKVCALHRRFIFQNGIFDMHFLWRRYGITVPFAQDDTMLAHHALQPEMEKGLGFLGSIYSDEASWKFMRKEKDTIKRED